MDPEGWALGKDREPREMTTSSKTATALQLPGSSHPGSAPGILWCDESPGSGAGEKPLSAGGFPEEQALEQGAGSLGTARCCFFGVLLLLTPGAFRRAELSSEVEVFGPQAPPGGFPRVSSSQGKPVAMVCADWSLPEGVFLF